MADGEASPQTARPMLFVPQGVYSPENSPIAVSRPGTPIVAGAPDPDYYIFNPNSFTPEQVRRICSNVIEHIYLNEHRSVNKCADDAGNLYTVKQITGNVGVRDAFRKSVERYIMIQNEGFPFVAPLLYAKTFDRSDMSTMINTTCGNNILITEYIEGDSLDKIPGDSLSYKTVRSILDQLNDILSRISAKGFVHRDIKGENIVLTPENRVYLIDFDTLCNTNDTSGTHSCRVDWWGSREQGGEALIVGTTRYTRPAATKRPYTYVPDDDKYALGILIKDQLRRISKDEKSAIDIIGENIWRKYHSGGRRTRKRSTKRKTWRRKH